MRFLVLWVGLSARLWGSCGIDPYAPLWLHGHALVLARPVMENGEKTLYKVDRVLWGMEKAPEELMIPDRGYVKEVPYRPRPVVDETPVVVAVARHRYTNHYVRRRWGACDELVFSTKIPEVRDFLDKEASGWKADLRIRTYVNGDERGMEGIGIEVERDGVKLRLVSDEKGIATAKGLKPGRYMLSVVNRLYEEQPFEVELTPGGGGTLQLGLMSPTLVRGRVLDAQGRPEAGRVLWLRRDRDVWDFFGARGQRRMVSEADGSFSAKGMPAGDYYLETVLPDAYYAGAAAHARKREGALKITVRDGQPVEGLEFRLPDFGGRRKLVVEVLRSDGQPLVGASVESRPEGKDGYLEFENRSLKTNADGRVETEIWGEGRYRILVFHSRWSEDLTPEEKRTVGPGKGPVRVRIVKGRRALPEGSRGR